jgi:hypothetical protein
MPSSPRLQTGVPEGVASYASLTIGNVRAPGVARALISVLVKSGLRPSKADIRRHDRDVRFVPIADIGNRRSLLTIRPP